MISVPLLVFGGFLVGLVAGLALCRAMVVMLKVKSGIVEDPAKLTAEDVERIVSTAIRDAYGGAELKLTKLDARLGSIQDNVDWLAQDRMIEVTSEIARTPRGEKLTFGPKIIVSRTRQEEPLIQHG